MLKRPSLDILDALPSENAVTCDAGSRDRRPRRELLGDDAHRDPASRRQIGPLASPPRLRTTARGENQRAPRPA